MPTLFNTISSGTADEVRTYNFISNIYYSGVPTGKLADHNGTPGNFTGTYQGDWLVGTALPSTNIILSSNNYHFYFPPVVGEPTEKETITGTVTTTKCRFRLSYDNNIHIGVMNNNNMKTNTISTQLAGTLTNPVEIGDPQLGITDSSLTNQNVFNFGVASNSTIALGGFITPNISGGDQLTTATRSAIYLVGWMHDGVYNTTPQEDWSRFNNCYILGYMWTSPNVYSTEYGGCPRGLNNTSNYDFDFVYKDITCLTGNYTPGLFLTDLLISYYINPTRPILGKVDNRVACMGRGLFEIGKVYRATNVFGRTGTEDWLCMCPAIPNTYVITNWSYGVDGSYTGAWKPNEFDYVLMRIYTEAD